MWIAAAPRQRLTAIAPIPAWFPQSAKRARVEKQLTASDTILFLSERSKNVFGDVAHLRLRLVFIVAVIKATNDLDRFRAVPVLENAASPHP
jgi:hypothetical protein